MKKFVTLAVLASLSLSAFAATSDDLKLKGKVPKKVSIVVNPEAVAMNLDLEADAEDLLVATVDENSNSADGYKITAQSANSGNLRNSNPGAVDISYTMKYEGVSVVLTGTSPVEVKNTTAPTSTLTDNSDVEISYTGAPHETRVSGNYTDTITFTISAN